MFEKEAEEWEKEITDNADVEIHFGKPVKVMPTKKQSFQKGAEFGYNKANEWHYVKDGDLPKHEVNVLVLYDIQCIGIAHYNYDYKEWHFADSIVHDVIAWNEIVPPKLEG